MMHTMDDYRALGRLQGAQDAGLGMTMCLNRDAEYRRIWNDVRLAQLEEKALALMAEGATVEQAQAFVDSAARRFEEACAEISLTVLMELDAARTSQPPPPSPPSGKRAKRREKGRQAAGLH